MLHRDGDGRSGASGNGPAEWFDVGIIGAGIHGAAAAFHLSRRGIRVVVFERGAPAGGPTGRSSAICRAYYTNEFLAGAARESIEMMEHFEDVTGHGADFHRTGALFLHQAEDRAEVAPVVARLNGQGIATELLERHEIRSRFPGFDLDGIGFGAWEAGAGYADPAAATFALLRDALAHDAVLHSGCTVTELSAREGGGAIVRASNGMAVSCARLLIAAGPWTGPLARRVGVDLPLTVERHIVGTFRWAGARPAPLQADVSGGYYLRPEGDGLFLVGPLHAGPPVDPDQYAERVSDQEIADLIRPVVRRIPELERSEVQGGWASLYDVSPDWQPVIGEIAPGILVDAGSSGHGFKLAPALGRHVADLVLGGPVDPGLDQFHPRRFAHHALLQAGYGGARILG